MATIANLMVNFSTNIASMVTDFEKTSKAVRNSSNEITSTLKMMKAGFAAVIGTETLKSGAEWIGQQMEMVEANKKTAESLNISYASLVNMQLVAKESGVQTEALTGSLDKMQKTIYSAATGSAKQADVFKQLGLNVKSLMALNPDQQFNKIASAISQLANPTERMGVAMSIFGKNAGQMVNVFNDFNGKQADATAFTQKFGLALSDIDAQKVVQAEQAMNKVKMASAGVAETIGVHLSPVIEGLAKDWLNASGGAQKWANFTDNYITLVAQSLDGLSFIIKTDIAAIKTFFIETTTGAIATYDILTGHLSDAKAVLAEGHAEVEQISKDWDKAAGSVGAAQTAVKKYYADANMEAANATQKHGNKHLTNMFGVDGTAEKEEALKRQRSLLKSITGGAQEYKQNLADLDVLYGGGKGPLSLEQYNDAVDKLNLNMLKTSKTASGGFMAGMLEVKKTFSDVGGLASKTVVDGFKNAEDAIVNFAETGKISVKGMVSSMIDDLIRLQVRQSITAPLFSALSGAMSSAASSGGFSSMFSSAASSIGSMLHFANGGSFKVGGGGGTDSQLVQFMASPSETVTVTNPGQSVSHGGGVTVVQNISIGAGVQGTVQAEIMRLMPELKKQAIAGVAEAQMRGMM